MSIAEPSSDTTAASPELDLALDLDGIGRDLADVEAALARLDAGTYWTDEVTGGELSDDLLAERPTARRAPAE
jgi:RNA polymerase-binding transcription factor DksA